MEEDSKLHTECNGEEADLKRVEGASQVPSDVERLTDENYTRSRKLWREYTKGKITLQQLNEGLAIQPSGKEESIIDTMKELFDGKII